MLTRPYEGWSITACGHEPTDPDLGIATCQGGCALETCVSVTDRCQIELLTDLDQVPEASDALTLQDSSAVRTALPVRIAYYLGPKPRCPTP